MQETWVRSLGWEEEIRLRTPVFWPGEFHGLCSPWGHKELDMTEQLSLFTRQHIKKQSHYFANKGPSSQGYGFPVVMYGCESWTIKTVEHQRIDAFGPWCWRTLKSPLDCKEIQTVHPKDISSKYSLEEVMLKLKLQYVGHLIQRADSLERTLTLGKIKGRR